MYYIVTQGHQLQLTTRFVYKIIFGKLVNVELLAGRILSTSTSYISTGASYLAGYNLQGDG